MKIADSIKEQLVEEPETRSALANKPVPRKAKRRETGNTLGQSALLEEAPIGICNADLKGKITYANKRFEEVSGYSRQEVVGKNALKIGMFSAETLRLLLKRLDERLMGRPSKVLELQFRCKDGHWIWVSVEGKVMKVKGIPVGFQIAARDITERKKVQETLQVERNKLQSVIDAIEYGISIVDPDYNVIYQNELFQRSSGNQVGEKCYRAYERKDKVCDGCPVAEAFKDGKSHTVEKRIEMPPGEVSFWEHLASPIRDDEGRITACLEITQNITERKQAEEELQVEKNKLQSVIDAMTDGLSIVDKDYNIIYRSLPSTSDGSYHLGEKCYQVFEGRDKVCHGCPVEKAFKDGKSHTAERRVVRPSGEVLFWENTANPIRDAGGKITSCLEIGRDITERKQAEEAIQVERNKLQSVIDAMEYGLTIQDRDYNTIYQNGPLKTFFGDRLGQKCYQVYENKNKVCADCPVEKAFKDGKSHSIERKITDPSGVRFMEYVANPVRDAEGKITSCLEITRDVTEHRQIQEALQVEKNKLQSVIDALEDGLSIQDRDYNILYQSGPSTMTGGYHLGEKCYQAFEGRDRVCPDCAVAKAFKDGKSHTVERKVTTPSGKVLFIENTANPIRDANGKIVSCLEINRNITERKQAEEALRESEKRLTEAQRVAKIGSWELDPAVGKGTWSAEMFRLTGFSPSQGAPSFDEFLEWVHPEDRQAFSLDFHGRVKQTGKSATFEFRSNPTRGPVRNILAHISATRDAKGHVVKMFGTLQDITERKQAEKTLRESEERFRSIVENSQAGILILDDSYRAVYANDELYKISGRSPEEVVGQDFRQFIDEESKQLVVDRYRRRQRGEEVPQRYEFNIIRKDGQKRRVELSSSVIRDLGGEVKTIAQILDITERKQAEEALRESREKLQTIFESISEGIIVIDLSGTIIEVNQKLVETHGFNSRDELIGKRAFGLIASQDREKAVKSMQQAVKRGALRDVELTLLRADGSEFFGELNVNVLKDALGKPVGNVTIVRDITSRRQAEEELRLRAQILDSATDSIFVHDADDNFIYVNEAACRTHGYSREELMKMKLRQLVPSERFSSLDSDRQTLLKKGSVVTESVHLRKDGSTVPVDVHARTLEMGGEKLFLTVARDITERKQAEDVFKTLATSAPIGVYIVQDGAFQFVSPHFQALLGFGEEELLGTQSLRLVHPEDREMVRENAVKMIKGGQITPYEYRYIGQDGQVKWVVETVAPIQYRGKRAVLGNFLDITERKQAEAALLESEERYRTLFEGSHDMIQSVAPDGHFFFVNRAWLETMGYTEAELPDLNLFKLIHPDSLPHCQEMFSKVMEEGVIPNIEATFITKDGRAIQVEGNATVRSVGDKIIATQGIFRDVTERNQIQAALRETQEFNSNLLENSPNPIFVVNPDTSIKYVNPAFEKLTGFNLADIIDSMAPYPWWPEEQKKELTSAFRDAMVGGGNEDECIMRKKDGGRFWVAINSAPITREGRLSYFLVSWLDITERKRAEEERMELEQKAHLASRLASVGEMASGIAHEINNPMTAVIGFSQLLLETDLPEDVKGDISVIHEEAQRAASVARNLLTFARKHSPAKQPTDINSIIEGVLKLRAYEQSVNNIRVNASLAPDLPQVMADYSQLQQVFINIVLNAESAMLEVGNGGTLTITTQAINGSVRASFTDSGPGIPKENLNRIFDPFFTTKEVGKGTGLGLSVCHGIIAEHGGRLYARSKVGRGATFIVELPVSVEAYAGVVGS